MVYCPFDLARKRLSSGASKRAARSTARRKYYKSKTKSLLSIQLALERKQFHVFFQRSLSKKAIMSWNNFDNSMQNEGGFMDTTVTEGGDDKASMKRGQNCIPLMIAHLNRYGEKLTVWGNMAKIVTFVGIVRKLEAMSTKVTFEFEDETGTIKGIKWLEGDNMDYESPVNVNSYARVYGLIRDQNDIPYVLIVNIQPMENLNELLTHLMEVTLVCLQGEKMVNQVARSDSTLVNKSIAQDSGNNASGLTQPQQLVLAIIQDSDPEYGAERDTIKSRVPQHIVGKVDEIIEFLSAEGHIYTTKTDDFFKAI